MMKPGPEQLEMYQRNRTKSLLEQLRDRSPDKAKRVLELAPNSAFVETVYDLHELLSVAIHPPTVRPLRIPDIIGPAAKAAQLHRFSTDDEVLALSIYRTLLGLRHCGEEVFGIKMPGIDSEEMAASICRLSGILMTQLARWSVCGCPSISLTSRQACALALSDLTNEQLEDSRVPWPSFLLFTEDAFFDPSPLTVVSCLTRPDGRRWSMSLISGEKFRGLFSLPAEVLFDKQLFEYEALQMTKSQSIELKDNVRRAINLIARCILNVCEAVNSSAASLLQKRERRTHKDKRGKKRKGKSRRVQGQGNCYVLGLPVKVDMRECVHEYIKGNIKRAYKVRWVVRGHWRNQPCGPGRMNRRKQWIEPYQKGKLEDPSLLRSHIVTDEVVDTRMKESVKEATT